MADAEFDGDVARTRQLIDQFGEWLDKYRGGMPLGWFASIMRTESNGNFGAAGDPLLGELGYFQVAAYVPPLFGLPAEARADPESNVAIASLEYALEAVEWKIAFPDAVELGTGDSWRLARLAFAIGRGGSHQLAQLADNAGGLRSGDVFGSIADYVLANGGVQLGSQSAAKVQARVLDVPRQWEIGQEAEPGSSGPPTRIPDPPAGPYTIPGEASDYFVQPLSSVTLLLLAGGLGLAYLLWRR